MTTSKDYDHLRHDRDPCGGSWEFLGDQIRCDSCFATRPATEDNIRAAEREHFAGVKLTELAKEGQDYLGRSLGPWENGNH